MKNSTTPIRIDAELLGAAKLAGSRQSRSAAQQIAHWARVGREVEASRQISAREIDDVLAGRRGYDTLEAADQAAVRAEWAKGLDAVADGIDLASAFAVSGRRSWVDIAADGTLVHRGAASGA